MFFYTEATAHDSTDPVTFDPTTEDFQLDILVTSNPPPHQFSLSLRYDENKPTQPICEEPVFADGGSTAIVTCTADRVVPPSTCEFRLTANSSALENTYRQHKAADQDSVIYPCYSRAQCTLRMPLTGNRAGDYQFQVEFTSRDSLKSEPKLTSKISLSE
ncbi:hypothetical protein ElyMa_005322800 [Elysia marginata]|uniref:Uncharacterized protein n=1 Tax=Elysia marginata TaxID=1093978 RepID=A0AAV4K123_9GAST|nr:hypothetical protein ElyMa_005322800 [Elysia marginata]